MLPTADNLPPARILDTDLDNVLVCVLEGFQHWGWVGKWKQIKVNNRIIDVSHGKWDTGCIIQLALVQ